MATGNDRVLVRNSAARTRAAKAKVLLCALALGLGVSVGYGQWLETKITLPDSLGGATDPFCLTADTSERYVYIGDASGRVYVVDAEAGTRVAKIPCTFVAAVCTNTRQNKVYVADYGGNRVLAISCVTNQVVSTIPLGAAGLPQALCYNSSDNRIYVASDRGDLTVIECSSDSAVKTMHLVPSCIN
jgi:YVTN family beta-propeller protein